MYWLNKAGGIDAHTFKGHSSLSYNASREIILRPKPNRMNWGVPYSSGSYPAPYGGANQAVTGIYESDTLRGGDVYNGGREVMSVDGVKSGKVTSLPLNRKEAEWLRELITSPNVWTEYFTKYQTASSVIHSKVAYRSVSNINALFLTGGRHPSDMDFTPLIITSSSVDVYDESQGLVTMTLEYTYAHPVITQRN
jgi:hypothetical protein